MTTTDYGNPITAAQMTKAQRETIAALTNALDRQHHDGLLSFKVEALAGGAVLLCVTNVHGDLRWFEKTADFYCFIGPRGGVEQYAGSLRKPWPRITGSNGAARERALRKAGAAKAAAAAASAG